MSKLVVSTLLVLTVAVNWPVLSAGTVYEDTNYTDYGVSRPLEFPPSQALTDATWWLQRYQSDRARHAVNLGLHLTAGTLVGVLAGPLPMGVFLLHPLQSEAVGYLASRADLVMTIGLLVAACSLTRRWWVGALTGSLIAMTGKEAGVAVVGLALLPWRATPPKLIVIAMSAVALLALPLAWSLYQVDGGWFWVQQQSAGLLGQLVGLVAPWTLMLAPDPKPLETQQVYALIAGLGALAAWMWRTRQGRLALGWLAATLVLRFVVPTPHSVLNSHQFYAPMVGFCLWLGSVHADHAV
jgi:hypothetical protein